MENQQSEINNRKEIGYIVELINEHFDLRAGGLVKMLDLLRPIYRKTSAYGHFGRSEPEFSWENTDMAKILKEKAGL